MESANRIGEPSSNSFLSTQLYYGQELMIEHHEVVHKLLPWDIPDQSVHELFAFVITTQVK